MKFCAANATNQQLWPAWKIRALAFIAWALRVQFKIDGYPFGGPARPRDYLPLTGDKGSA